MKRVALYIRVSHEEQAMKGYSLQAQENRLRQYANEHHYQIVDYYRDEGVTARSCPGRRKEFARMLRDIKAGHIDCILFIKLDRWFRNVSDYYTYQALLDQHNVIWETTEEEYNTHTAQGRLYLNIKLSIAQNESDTTSERIHFVFADKIKRREVISGKLPIGYSIANKHIIQNAQAPIIRDIFQYYLNTHSIHKTMHYLANIHNIHRSYPAISKLLRNERYIGTFYGIKNYTTGIIDKQTFETVQQLLKNASSKTISSPLSCANNIISPLMASATAPLHPPSNITNTTENRHENNNTYAKYTIPCKYLFKGLLRCPHCNHKLVGLTRHYKGTHYIYYQCPQSHHKALTCPNKTLYKESLIEKNLLTLLPTLLPKAVTPLTLIATNSQELKPSNFPMHFYWYCHQQYPNWVRANQYQYWHWWVEEVTLPTTLLITHENIKLKHHTI
ncbi:recombinase family protein [Veillonella criceti]|uniref:Transposase and inactivated derivatives n=1 Tax=Veillonella criceti TaxID=103891 RepID=A0A380NCS4_9FIRM|nr:recombinase family protein [Veillonella criceti]SUP37110.1 Transposase and inactivated derivatives [Veillonella criceti]SUP45120.1 Transposase and inactivated derivatives [Veillonella criceti]